MSKERELLYRWYRGARDRVDFNELYDTTVKLLTQPEPELLDLDKVDKHLEICDKSEEYRDGYSDGIVFTERHHGMRGQHE